MKFPSAPPPPNSKRLNFLLSSWIGVKKAWMRSVPVILRSTSRFSRVAIWAISLPLLLL